MYPATTPNRETKANAKSGYMRGLTQKPARNFRMWNGRLPLTADSTAEQWLADPHAAPWLRSVMDTGPLAARLADPQRGQLMRAIPLSPLARFPGFPLDDKQIAEAVDRFSGLCD